MPPRAMWKGAISFGLVTIPVSVYPATEEKSLRFNQLHDVDLGRIRYKRVCSIDGQEVEYDHIVKGYEVEKDRYVVLTDEDLEAVPVRSSRAIDIQQFVELSEIDPVLYKKSYYLVPDETGAKAYALLRRALTEENKVGIAKVSFRDKEHLAALRFKGDVFVLETMYWPDEIREASFDTLGRDEDIRPNEVRMAKQLIESLTEPWDPTRYRDEYREALLELVEKKLAGEPIEVPEEAPPARIVDLMAALKASVEAAKARMPAEGAPTKRSTAKRGAGAEAAAKPAARKAAARKAAARKASAARAPAKAVAKKATTKRAAAPRKKAVGE
jgi:DNA end-binding protein Ku